MVNLFKRSGRAGRVAGGPAGPVTVTLVGRAGCHLCDDARTVVLRVAGETGAVMVEEDIDAPDFDPGLREEYAEQIPVTLVNGARHDFWRVDEGRLRRAIQAAGRG